MNLISNAVKFTKRDRVSLKVGWHSDEMMFKIEDTGAGNPDDLRHRIFNDFVTGNAVYDREVNGSGLGLSIAKRFIHLLGGEIAVASELGVGSTFRVVVPAKIAFHKSNRFARLRDPVWLHRCGYWLLRITRSTELSYARC